MYALPHPVTRQGPPRLETRRWAWGTPSARPAALPGGGDVLEAGDPAFDEAASARRMTPAGLAESDLLAALNYLDEVSLRGLPGIGPALAAQIAQWRAASRYFSSLEDVTQVPKLGAGRFRRLVGRPPLGPRFRLHDLVRRDRREHLRIAHFRPLERVSPELPRIVLGRPEDEEAEQAVASKRGWKLLHRKVRDRVLYFHASVQPLTGRAAELLQQLPAVLRRQLTLP